MRLPSLARIIAAWEIERRIDRADNKYTPDNVPKIPNGNNIHCNVYDHTYNSITITIK
jgi:hypothetical protein